MQTRRRDQFSTVRTEGPILPPDLLRRIADDDKALGGLTPEAYHLGSGERLNEVINRSWNRLLGAWATFRTSTATLGETDAATGLTRDRWLYPLFQELGYGRLPLARGIEVDGTHYPISHAWGTVPIHLVGAGVDLDRRAAGVAGAARVSPHGLVQDLLNRSADHLWGFASNGLRLRVLRDNVSITRQSYVEWDLEAMMDGEVYADFALLWLVCHQSRVEGERPDEYWLEKWTRAAQEQGTRALDQLRGGVEQAITALGKGFLAHPANGELRKALQDGPASGGLDTQEYYRQLLRLVYRLLFLFVAEDRDVLLDPNAEPAARERYTSYYSTARLRRLADRRVGTRHHDLYQGLRLVMAKLGDAGSPPLGLPALGGYLFSTEAVRDLAEREIANHDLLDAIRALAFVEDGRSRRLVDYRNLGAEELGSVYESLLELHPEIDSEAATFTLKTASGNERKTTGSYYTPTSLIQCLLDSALDPVLEEAAAKPDPEAAILDLKVCDPACGSGHFLIAAAHRIAKRLAAIRTGEPEPSPEAVRTALRQVVGSCIYGVDLNPMAVELCKVSLWMEAVEPGKPLTFLDHHIQSGNSLLGTTPALLAKGIPDEAFTPIEGDDRAFCTEYRKQNRLQRTGRISISMFDAEARPWEHFGNLATAMLALDDEDADTIEGQRRKQERYEQMVRSDDYLYGRLLADAWCAAFVWKKAKTTDLSYPITHERFLDIERSPFNVPAWMHGEIRRLAEQYGFFHWHLAFPDVFHVPSPSEKPENEQAGWSRGFDVVLGNPPWERIKLQEKEWFATRRPDIAAAPTAAVRKKMIESLKTADPPLYADWLDALRQSDGESQLLRSSGRFPLTGRGDINTYAVFAETIRTILRSVGRVGCIVPTGIATDDTTKLFFQDLMEAGSLVSLFSFENEEKIFPTVHHAYKFCLLTVSGHERKSTVADFTFFVRQPGDLVDRSRAFSLSSGDLKRLNPNSSSCPTFRSRRDAELNLQIYRHVPVLVNEATDLNPWGVRFLAMLHMANDSGLFQDDPTVDRVPLYEAKLFHHFDHRASTYEGATQEQLNVNILPRPTPTQKADPDCRVSPRHWVPEDDVLRRIGSRVPAIIWDAYLREDRQLALESLSLWFAGYALNHGRIDAGGRILDGVFPSRYVPTSVLWADGARRLEAECPLTEADFAATEGITDDLEMLNQLVEVRRPKWLLVFRDIARSTDERTAIFSVLPRVGVGHTAPVMFADGVAAPMPTLLFGSLNCFVFDYAARQKVGGTHLTFGLLRQLPVLPPDAYGPRELAFIVPRVLELTYTAWDLEPFAKDVGYDGPPFRWDEDRRFLLRAELDALYFRLYGIERDDVDYIMETFPIVKRRDEQRHGSYRAKDTILEIYDALADAERTGVPYQTPLDPPPADPRVAHPNRDGTPYTGPGWQLPAGDGVITRQPTEHPNTAAVSASTATAASTQAASRAGGTPKEGRVAASDAPSRRSAVTRLPSQPTLLDRDPLFAEVKAEPTSRPQSRPSQTRLPSQPPLLDRDPLFAEPASDTRPAHPPTAPSPTPPSEPTIPASEDDEQMLRGRVLEGAINVLQGSGPLTARDLAQQLAAIDARIDRRLVNSVLHREGAKSVRYDAARYTYTLRSKS